MRRLELIPQTRDSKGASGVDRADSIGVWVLGIG